MALQRAVEARGMPQEGAQRKNIRQLISIGRATMNQKALARKVQLVNNCAAAGGQSRITPQKI